MEPKLLHCVNNNLIQNILSKSHDGYSSRINGTLYANYTYFVILLTVVLDLVFFVGEPAEIHQCHLSGPPCEQE